MPFPKVSREWDLEECTSHLPGTHRAGGVYGPLSELGKVGQSGRRGRREIIYLLFQIREVISCPTPGPTGEDGPARPGS